MNIAKWLIIQFLASIGLKLWPYAEPSFKRFKWLGIVMFFSLFIILILSLFLGCATPRSHSIFSLQFSEQAPKVLMSVECRGRKSVQEGVFVCEEKEPKRADVTVKIMPTPGRVIFSDGLQKKVVDFNWRKDGFWIWRKTRLTDTWVPLDFGELNSIFGDVPIAIDVAGFSDSGVIVNRGIIYTRICNDRDIPCSRLIVKYDCAGSIKNTYEGQLGSCSRMSGSSQKFSLPIKTLNYELKKGSKLFVRSGRSTWTLEHTIDAADIEAGEFKFLYPEVLDGPDLFSIAVGQFEQGVLQEYHTHILIVGFNPKWTGIDQPHFIKENGNYEFCIPVTADLMEIVEGNVRRVASKECISWSPLKQVCAYAYDRESGDSQYTCVQGGKEVRYPN